MRDFTLSTYKLLLDKLHQAGYNTYPLEMICRNVPGEAYVVLRHDVDRNHQNALKIARLEKAAGVVSTYYFRINKKVFIPEIIREISEMGHEVGYHYEDLTSMKGDVKKAEASFKRNIEKFRELVHVSTVSMHGKPLSKFDNKKLTEVLDLKGLNILCEPYSVVNRMGLVYLTDVGRKWNNRTTNFRDKAEGQDGYDLRSTFDVIEALGNKLSGKNLMLNIHPERWNEEMVPWMRNAVWQKIKNAGKYILINLRSDG